MVSTLFVSSASSLTYLQAVIPWFAILLVSLFFILVLTGFIGDKDDVLKKSLGRFFVYALLLVFLLAAFFTFSSLLSPYLPGGNTSGANRDVLRLVSWLYEGRSAGAFWLVVVSAFVSWILVSTGKKK